MFSFDLSANFSISFSVDFRPSSYAHLHDLIDVLDLVRELHLYHPDDVLDLHGRPHHAQQKQKLKRKQLLSLQQHRGRAKRTPTFAVAMNAGLSGVYVSVPCDQVDQVVSARQVDDIDDLDEQDPVHLVDHKDEHTGRHWSKIWHSWDSLVRPAWQGPSCKAKLASPVWPGRPCQADLAKQARLSWPGGTKGEEENDSPLAHPGQPWPTMASVLHSDTG